MADYFSFRVPLHPEDADYFRKQYDTADENLENAERTRRRLESMRLGEVAAHKRAYELAIGRGPVDQEQSLRYGIGRTKDYAGYQNAADLGAGLARLDRWAKSKPESRNVFMQAMLAPEQAIMHTAGAFTEGQSDGERLNRLAMAPVAAFFPDMGYPVQKTYDRMYDEVGPVAGAVVDMAVMPGLGEAGDAASSIRRLLRSR